MDSLKDNYLLNLSDQSQGGVICLRKTQSLDYLFFLVVFMSGCGGGGYDSSSDENDSDGGESDFSP